MNEAEFDRVLAELIAQPGKGDQALRDAAASEEDVAELLALAQTADKVWLAAQGAPPLDEDPVAAMLGLIPDALCALQPVSFRRARQRSGVAASALAGRLRVRGWAYSTADVVRWHTAAADVPPAVVQAIAEELRVDVDAIIQQPGAGAQDRFAAVRQDPLFEQIVARWARVRHTALAVARAELDTRMMATVHRGQLPDPTQVLSALDALVRAVEDDAG